MDDTIQDAQTKGLIEICPRWLERVAPQSRDRVNICLTRTIANKSPDIHEILLDKWRPIHDIAALSGEFAEHWLPGDICFYNLQNRMAEGNNPADLG